MHLPDWLAQMSTTHSSFDQYCINHKTISHRAAAAPGPEVRRECPLTYFPALPLFATNPGDATVDMHEYTVLDGISLSGESKLLGYLPVRRRGIRSTCISGTCQINQIRTKTVLFAGNITTRMRPRLTAGGSSYGVK